MITFTNVSKSFNGHTVLNNINLKLPRYGLVVIQGPSGCGKTTLLNLLSGLLPFKGNINLDGHNIGSMNQNQMDEFRLKNYGFVFQDFKLFESETVMTNIIFPLESVSTASKETKNRKVLDLINMVGLKKSAKQRVLYTWRGDTILDGELSARLSHGCVRLSPENSRWIYETAPLGAVVWVN